MDEHNYMDDQAGQIPEGYEPGSDADIHISSILFVGIIGAVLIIVIVLLLKALYYQTLHAERERKEGTGIDVTLSDMRSKQLEQIGTYRWVDPRAGKVGIPIEEAMTLVWQEQSTHPNNGIEITDWDHNASDEHPVPGDLVSLAGSWSSAVSNSPTPSLQVLTAPGMDGSEPAAVVGTQATKVNAHAVDDGEQVAEDKH